MWVLLIARLWAGTADNADVLRRADTPLRLRPP